MVSHEKHVTRRWKRSPTEYINWGGVCGKIWDQGHGKYGKKKIILLFVEPGALGGGLPTTAAFSVEPLVTRNHIGYT